MKKILVLFLSIGKISNFLSQIFFQDYLRAKSTRKWIFLDVFPNSRIYFSFFNNYWICKVMNSVRSCRCRSAQVLMHLFSVNLFAKRWNVGSSEFLMHHTGKEPILWSCERKSNLFALKKRKAERRGHRKKGKGNFIIIWIKFSVPKRMFSDARKIRKSAVGKLRVGTWGSAVS